MREFIMREVNGAKFHMEEALAILERDEPWMYQKDDPTQLREDGSRDPRVAGMLMQQAHERLAWHSADFREELIFLVKDRKLRIVGVLDGRLEEVQQHALESTRTYFDFIQSQVSTRGSTLTDVRVLGAFRKPGAGRPGFVDKLVVEVNRRFELSDLFLMQTVKERKSLLKEWVEENCLDVLEGKSLHERSLERLYKKLKDANPKLK